MLKIESPAKINLTLEVLGKRPDGFHEIRSLMQTIDLCDSVTIEEHRTRGHIEMHSDTMGCPVDEKNLVWQAVQLLRDATGFDLGLSITIQKRIYVAGGLGGGSSNAGTVLRALVDRYQLDIDSQSLFALASRIGSDVPFFLVGGTALATGRGEKIEEVEQLPQSVFVLANPRVSVETRRVYESKTLAEQIINRRISGNASAHFLEHIASPDRWRFMTNDLQAPARSLYPAIDELLTTFAAMGIEQPMLAGSGGTVFANIGSLERGEALVSRLKLAGFSALTCHSIDHRQFERLALGDSSSCMPV